MHRLTCFLGLLLKSCDFEKRKRREKCQNVWQTVWYDYRLGLPFFLLDVFSNVPAQAFITFVIRKTGADAVLALGQL